MLLIYKLDRKFDFVLMYGASTPHFDPWSMIRLLSGISHVLMDDGVFIVEDTDRRYTIFYLMKYKDVISGKTLDGNVYLDMHTGYMTLYVECLKGHLLFCQVQRSLWRLIVIIGDHRNGCLIMGFFRDVDIVRHVRGGFHYFIIAANPRKILVPEDLIMEPKAIAKK